MDYEAELLSEAKKAIQEYPEHRCEIIDLYSLAIDEIHDGESAANEYELFQGSIGEIRNEQTKERSGQNG